MPKLKKISEKKSRTLDQDSQPLQTDKYLAQTEGNTDVQDLIKPTRMKYSTRIKRSSKRQKKTLQQSGKSEELKEHSEPFDQKKEEGQRMSTFLSKFTDNDDDSMQPIDQVNMQLKRKSIKSTKTEIKTKNKMFSDVNFQESSGQPQKLEHIQQLQIQVEQKKKILNGDLMEKFQKKASVYKDKLAYKDLNKDQKYKKDMQFKLKQIAQFEELNVVVEVPKVSGQRQLDAALFLKNQEQGTQQITDPYTSQPQEDELSQLKDRKTYYEELGKQVRMKKADNYSQSKLKEMFKKSMLDDKDFIFELDQNTNASLGMSQKNTLRHSEQSCSRPMQIKPVNEKVSKDTMSNKSGEENDRNNQETTLNNLKTKQSLEQIKENQKFPKRSKEKDKKPEETTKNTQKDITKKQKQKKTYKDKTKNFKYKHLVELEAQLSDDEEAGPKQKDEGEESSQDDTDLESMIDNEAELNSNDMRVLQRKFIADVVEDQEKKYQEIRKKIERRYIQEQEQLKRRMLQAARRNKENDQKDKLPIPETELQHKDNTTSVPTSNNSLERQKNQQKIKQLQELIGDNKNDKKMTQGNLYSNKLQEIEGIVSAKNQGLKKVTRNGFKNIQAHKKSFDIPKKK